MIKHFLNKPGYREEIMKQWVLPASPDNAFTAYRIIKGISPDNNISGPITSWAMKLADFSYL